MTAVQRLTGFALALLALGAFTLFTPLAFAEEDVESETETTATEVEMMEESDYEAEAEEKIDAVEAALEDAEEKDEALEDEDVRSERAGIRAEVKAMLAEARELWNDGEYKEAYAKAREAYDLLGKKSKEKVAERMEKVKENCTDDDGCPNLKKKRAAACEADMLEDGERDRVFCRDGEWKEKREAKLDDIMSGFVEAADLTEEQSEQVRAEVQALVRQLITLILANRLGS